MKQEALPAAANNHMNTKYDLHAILERRRWKFHPVYILVTIISLHLCTAIDNDTWWLLAMGRNILENGIPHYEPLTIHSGLDFIAQQWLTSVIFQSIYGTLGAPGLALLVGGCMLGSELLLFRLCSVYGEKSRFALAVSALANIVLCGMFGTARPQIFTYLIVLIELTMLWRYRDTNKWQYLLPLPILSLLQINLHASMWLMLFVFTAPLFAEWIVWHISEWLRKRRGFSIAETRFAANQIAITPLLLAVLSMAAAGFLNPYGFKMMLYLKNSFGVAIIDNFVQEMHPISWNNGGFLLAILILSIIVVCVSKKKLPVSYLCYIAGTAILMLRSAKGTAYFLLCSMPVVAYAVGGWQWDRPARKHLLDAKMKVLIWVIVLPYAAFMLLSSYLKTDLTDFDTSGAGKAIEWVEENYEIRDTDKLYAGYNTGGYLEFRGYRPYIDARAEVFLEKNNGKADIFREYLGVNILNASDFLDRYDFAYLFVGAKSGLSSYLNYESDHSGYTLLYIAVNKDSEDADIEVWIRADLAEARKLPEMK